ncbi:hypothetical protein [Bifidobacterium adolescentis]|jgi:hypothetical protein|uniref:hypothetical protein n=1 Tax=Bifidobacterium adolescentis TaxID=1680 RepID=UPI00321C2C73
MVEKPNTSPAKLLTADEALALGRRPEVVNVLKNKHGWWVIFTTQFQDEVTLRYLQGERPSEIFRSHNLGPEVLGYKRIERCIYRWVNHPSKTRIRRWQAEHRLYETLNNKQTNPDKKENGDK